jgi:anti-anti-sigma factor
MSPAPSVSVVRDADVVVVSVSGEIDLANASAMEESILEAVPNDGAGLVFDASELTYLDSSGVRLLLSVAARLRWRDLGFVLVAPPASRCRRVLSLAGVDGALAIEDSVDGASAQLRGGPPGLSS